MKLLSRVRTSRIQARLMISMLRGMLFFRRRRSSNGSIEIQTTRKKETAQISTNAIAFRHFAAAPVFHS
jgi:hypothetical protein